jgi:hypothetical protein
MTEELSVESSMAARLAGTRHAVRLTTKTTAGTRRYVTRSVVPTP